MNSEMLQWAYERRDDAVDAVNKARKHYIQTERDIDKIVEGKQSKRLCQLYSQWRLMQPTKETK